MTENGNPQADTEEFRRAGEDNMKASDKWRQMALLILVLTGVALLSAFASISFAIGPGLAKPLVFLIAVPALITAAAPFLLLAWMMNRWAFEAKTLAYGFQRKAIVEERLFRYAGDNARLREELLKIYLVHWMEKSPLEVMLALGGKSKGMGASSPTAALLGATPAAPATPKEAGKSPQGGGTS